MPIDYGVAALNFEIIGCKKVKYHFQHHNSKTITVINLNLGADMQAESSKMTLQWASGISHIILHFISEVMGIFWTALPCYC